jgi:hypothetical protein
MPLKWFRGAALGVLASAALQSVGHAAPCNPGDICSTQTIQDFYFGGLNTFNNQDVIGPTNVFGVSSAVLTRDATANTLTVQVNTNFAGAPASNNLNVAAALLGQSYGALFLGPGGTGSIWLANHPTPPSAGNTYPNDLYHPGEWTVAVNMNGSGNTGAAGVYKVGGPQNGGTQTAIINSSYPGAAPNSNTGNVPVAYSTTDSHGNPLGQVVMSNEYGNPITYPNPGNGTFNGQRLYFRQGQAVQFNPDASASTIAGTGSSSYVIIPTVWAANGNVITEGSITYTITDFTDLGLGNDIALSWSESCANDILQGPGGGGTVPIPTALPLFAGGLAVLGFVGFRRKTKRLNALAA